LAEDCGVNKIKALLDSQLWMVHMEMDGSVITAFRCPSSFSEQCGIIKNKMFGVVRASSRPDAIACVFAKLKEITRDLTPSELHRKRFGWAHSQKPV
jgi:hypothetical protein